MSHIYLFESMVTNYHTSGICCQSIYFYKQGNETRIFLMIWICFGCKLHVIINTKRFSTVKAPVIIFLKCM